MRLFVAGYPPPDAVTHLSGYLARLHTVRAGARLASPDTWHVTLAFLGELPADRLAEAIHAVNLAAAATSTTSVGPVLRITGGGSFGRGRSTVLWAGLEGDVPELLELAAALRRALAIARLPYDRKPVRPHLTLARPGDRVPETALAEDLATLDRYSGPPWPLTELRLIESHPSPHPTYQTHRTAPLRPHPTTPT